MSHVSDFTQSGDKIVLDLVNADNNSFFTLSTVSVARGSAAPVTKNSTALLTSLAGSGYSGDVHVEYDRLALQSFVDIFYPAGLTVQLGDATDFADLLEEVNTALGTNLVLDTDVATQAIPVWEGIPNETHLLTVPVLASSLVYTGQMQFTLDGNDIALSSVITTTVLSGLNLPVPPIP